MELLERLNKYISADSLNEAPTMTRAHYTWFLEKFAEACKKITLRRAIYLELLDALTIDFAETNPQFKPEIFKAYGKKLFGEKEDENDPEGGTSRNRGPLWNGKQWTY